MNFLSKLCCFLSLYVLASVGWQTFYKPTAEQYALLNTIDHGVCVVFLTDFFVRLWKAKDKVTFWKWGWIDLVCSIPAFGPISWDKYYYVLRFIRALRSLKYLSGYILNHKKTSKLFNCCALSIIFIIVAAIGVFNCEKHVEGANIKNVSDALWWSLATITTIGYGDRFPVSDSGRVFAAFVMIGGVGLFASFTGFIVSKFNDDDRMDKLIADNAELHRKIDLLLNK